MNMLIAGLLFLGSVSNFAASLSVKSTEGLLHETETTQLKVSCEIGYPLGNGAIAWFNKSNLSESFSGTRKSFIENYYSSPQSRQYSVEYVQKMTIQSGERKASQVSIVYFAIDGYLGDEGFEFLINVFNDKARSRKLGGVVYSSSRGVNSIDEVIEFNFISPDSNEIFPTTCSITSKEVEQ